MKVYEILKEKGDKIHSICPEASISDAVSLLCEHNIGSLVVIDESSAIKGIITERDVLRNVAACSNSRIKVKDIMSKEVVIGLPDDEIAVVMKVMTQRKIRHLPIMNKGKLAGVISIGDVLKSLHDEESTKIRYLENYVSGGYM
jgi:CBS domain-containing protein